MLSKEKVLQRSWWFILHVTASEIEINNSFSCQKSSTSFEKLFTCNHGLKKFSTSCEKPLAAEFFISDSDVVKGKIRPVKFLQNFC